MLRTKRRPGRLVKWIRWSVLVTSAIVLLPYVFSRCASPWRAVTVHVNAKFANGKNHSRSTLRIGAYNIAHGRGTADGNWSGGDENERRGRLNAIAELITAADLDVVVLNEVDFAATWSYHVNQAAWIAEATEFPYWVEQRNLDFRFAYGS